MRLPQEETKNATECLIPTPPPKKTKEKIKLKD